MVVGYALGNRYDQEADIEVLGEDGENVITFTKAIEIPLSKVCAPTCRYCAHGRKENLVVPYSTIQATKKARTKGAREVLYRSNEKPERYPQIKANLELWGFKSFIDYLYTVIELGFLEGLIPVLDCGFLSPLEMKRMSEVAAIIRIPLLSVEDIVHENQGSKKNAKRAQEVKNKRVEWAGKLRFPISTGFVIGAGELGNKQKNWLEFLAAQHQEYGMIQEVVLEPYQPKMKKLKELPKPSENLKEKVIEAVKQAQAILPNDISIIVPLTGVLTHEEILDLGIRDFGGLTEAQINEIGPEVERSGYRLQQRFPLRRDFIKNGIYSSKLGQVFDAYRYKIRKEVEAQEKVKVKA